MSLNPFTWFRHNQKSESADIPQIDDSKMSDGATVYDLTGAANLFPKTNESTALKIEAVFACLRDKSETIGQMPLFLYEYDRTGKRIKVESGRNYRIFTQNPCEFLTFQEFMEFLTISYERRGVFYAYIQRNDRGTPMQIIPFRNQENVNPQMDLNGNVYYTYVRNDGSIGDPYLADELLIIKGPTTDGFTPISPIQQTATNLGIAYAQEQSYLEAQTNGITSKVALSTDAVFRDENAIKRLQDDWKKYTGIKGASRVPVLENGLKPISLKLTPAETELLEHSEFSVNRICRTFRVPIHRVGVTGTSGSSQNIFDLDEAYLRDSLNPILMKVESALNKWLPPNQKVVFNRFAFYLGSPWRLIDKIEKAVKGGLLSINEGRDIIGLEPVEGGDVFAIDNNNVVYGFWKDLEAIKEQLYGAKPNNTETPTP